MDLLFTFCNLQVLVHTRPFLSPGLLTCFLCLEYTSPQISIELTPSSLKSLIKRHLLNEAFSTCRRISQCPARKTETTPDILTGGNLIQGAVYTGEGIAEEPNKAALETTQITEPAGAADTPGAKHRGE